MTFYLIGLGMTENSLTAETLEILKQADKIYLENYTINFPYDIKNLLPNIYNLIPLSRESVESEEILQEAKQKNIALLVYGDALSATTHIQLILSAKKQNIPYKIFHNASILTTVAETGLQLYKFGKTTSMPNWTEHTNKPTSFANYIKQNQSIQAHTLILTDIGLEIKDAINQLKQSCDTLPEKIIALSNAGTDNQKIFYDTPDNLAKLNSKTDTLKHSNTNTLQMQNIYLPFCLIIPSNLNHTEKEFLKILKPKTNPNI
ncbi:MAG: diphthine synthase [Nanoarchaeota archaeon]|nr:diphthine synthase [Nanoarchaeota archaeon]